MNLDELFKQHLADRSARLMKRDALRVEWSQAFTAEREGAAKRHAEIMASQRIEADTREAMSSAVASAEKTEPMAELSRLSDPTPKPRKKKA